MQNSFSLNELSKKSGAYEANRQKSKISLKVQFGFSGKIVCGFFIAKTLCQSQNHLNTFLPLCLNLLLKHYVVEALLQIHTVIKFSFTFFSISLSTKRWYAALPRTVHKSLVAPSSHSHCKKCLLFFTNVLFCFAPSGNGVQ